MGMGVDWGRKGSRSVYTSIGSSRLGRLGIVYRRYRVGGVYVLESKVE